MIYGSGEELGLRSMSTRFHSFWYCATCNTVTSSVTNNQGVTANVQMSKPFQKVLKFENDSVPHLGGVLKWGHDVDTLDKNLVVRVVLTK